ncbi:MAG: hypothetical protein GDA54_01990 [Alphaproteobacteria bacterium GM7ARS4]|nr:hypothetical protein [Alphaproteobacteria bacterium GM7ARS4]
MTNDQIKELALALAYADKAEDVVKILRDKGYWDDESAWCPYGGDSNSNNFSVVGNQQGAAARALVEKLTNAVDA